MPIYEFYCQDCHTVFHFYSKTVNTRKRPACPKCGREELERRMSLFSISRGGEDAEESELGVDESRMEKAMEWMARQSGQISEDDPRQAARLMREFSDMTGVEPGPAMQEALSRMEAGEDPEQVESEMGEALENDELFIAAGRKGSRQPGRQLPPKTDDTLYEL